MLAEADQQSGNFNGNDVVTIIDADGAVVDSLGKIGDSSPFAANTTLRRTDLTADSDPTDPWTPAAWERRRT